MFTMNSLLTIVKRTWKDIDWWCKWEADDVETWNAKHIGTGTWWINDLLTVLLETPYSVRRAYSSLSCHERCHSPANWPSGACSLSRPVTQWVSDRPWLLLSNSGQGTSLLLRPPASEVRGQTEQPEAQRSTAECRAGMVMRIKQQHAAC